MIQLRNSATAWENAHLRIRIQDFENRGAEGKYSVVDRTNTNPIVSVLAVTKRRTIFLIDQFRIPQNGRVIELPAGFCEPGENPETGAQRELLEETGCTGSEWEYITTTPTSSGLTSERLQLFIVRNVERVTDILMLDHAEDIVVHEVAITDIRTFLREQEYEGKLVDSKIASMLWHETESRKS